MMMIPWSLPQRWGHDQVRTGTLPRTGRVRRDDSTIDCRGSDGNSTHRCPVRMRARPHEGGDAGAAVVVAAD